jgi:hypothetical protein
MDLTRATSKVGFGDTTFRGVENDKFVHKTETSNFFKTSEKTDFKSESPRNGSLELKVSLFGTNSFGKSDRFPTFLHLTPPSHTVYQTLDSFALLRTMFPRSRLFTSSSYI